MTDRLSFHRCWGTWTVMLCAACGGGSTIIEPPPPPPPASFKVVLAPDPEDGTTAQALGWAARIPDADVILTPTAGSAAPRTARSTATGTADFGNVPSGN